MVPPRSRRGSWTGARHQAAGAFETRRTTSNDPRRRSPALLLRTLTGRHAAYFGLAARPGAGAVGAPASATPSRQTAPLELARPSSVASSCTDDCATDDRAGDDTPPPTATSDYATGRPRQRRRAAEPPPARAPCDAAARQSSRRRAWHAGLPWSRRRRCPRLPLHARHRSFGLALYPADRRFDNVAALPRAGRAEQCELGGS